MSMKHKMHINKYAVITYFIALKVLEEFLRIP